MKLRQLFSVISIYIIIVLISTGCSNKSNNLVVTPVVPTVTGNLLGSVFIDQGNLGVMTRATNLRAVEGAIISVKGYPELIATTVADGSFQLSKIPVGIRTFYISKAGYNRVTFQQTILEGNNAATPVDLKTAAKFKWTVMVYMAADNNMNSQAISDMNELEMVGSTTDVKLLTQVDIGLGDPVYNNSYYTLTGCHRYEIEKDTGATSFDRGRIISNPLEDLGSIDSGNPQTLNNFITWGQTYAPAEHYLVILWNHGSGWDPIYDKVLLQTRAIAVDSSTGHWIKIKDLNYALTTGNPIDIIAMDACLMSMAEIAYQIRGCAEYMVTSEEVSPLIGYAYQNIAAKIIADPVNISSRTLADFIAQDAKREWTPPTDTPNINQLDNLSTQSVIDLGQMDAMVSKLNLFCDRLIEIKGNYQNEIIDARKAASFGTTSKDLYHYVSLIRASINDADLRAKADTLMAQLKNNTIVSNYTFSGHINSAGLAIDIQAPVFWKTNHAASYSALSFAKDSHWDEWMAAQ